jgi:hypothetical protein
MTITLDRGPCTARTPGLAGYKHDRCRCRDCTEASVAYDTRRVRQIAYGRWRPLVDAGPIRAHLRTLMASGIGWQRIADLAGVPAATVSCILYGKAGGRPPTRRIHHGTAEALLAVQPDINHLADGTAIDATGTRRRTQALAAIGWSITQQAARLGRSQGNHQFVLTNRQVTVATARIVRELYDQLSLTLPTPSCHVTKTRNWAARQGWAPPLAWDDDTIDDPAAQPDLGDPDATVVDDVLIDLVLAGKRADLTETERVDVVRAGRRRGMPLSVIAVRLHVSYTEVKRLNHHAGRLAA